jgi:hypothetical protein
VNEQRFQTGFREASVDDPGLVLGNDGVVSVVLPDGSREPVGGGSQTVVEDRAPLNNSGGYFLVSWPDDASSGTFTLILNGEETAPIAWDADNEVIALNVLDALNALPSVSGVLEID